MKPKIIAFYLPQFHTTPENDKWWGEGFTDWVSARNAERLVPGHTQRGGSPVPYDRVFSSRAAFSGTLPAEITGT